MRSLQEQLDDLSYEHNKLLDTISSLNVEQLVESRQLASSMIEDAQSHVEHERAKNTAWATGIGKKFQTTIQILKEREESLAEREQHAKLFEAHFLKLDNVLKQQTAEIMRLNQENGGLADRLCKKCAINYNNKT